VSVAVDSMILIWGMKGATKKKKTTPEVAEKKARALILFDDLQEQNQTVIIPTISVSELLCGIDYVEHGSFIEVLQKNLSIHPFDLPAASLAARLWQISKETATPKDKLPERIALKADLMILATASVAKASIFYSNDAWCRKMAEKIGLTARDLPTHSENMFKDFEYRKKPKTNRKTSKISLDPSCLKNAVREARLAPLRTMRNAATAAHHAAH
jgi:predicted nucleic acid-binding protein